YAITADLVVLKSVEIYGAGLSKTIIKSTAPDGLEIQGWPNKPVVKVRDLSLVGDGNCASCLGVYNDGRNALATLTLQRVTVSAFTRAGVHNDAGRMTLDHVRVGPNSNGSGPGGGIINDGFVA